MSSLTFVINDASTDSNNPKVQVTITENANGTLSFNIVQLVSPQGGYVGDLRGFFFDLHNENLIGKLSIEGSSAATGKLQQGNDSVVDLGNGANMNGLTNAEGMKTSKTAGAEQNGYDAGFEIGSAGIGSDDVQSLSFTLKANDKCKLSLADFANVDFGVRITSVGPVDGQGKFTGARDGSSKIAEHTFTPTLKLSDAALGATFEDTKAAGSLFDKATVGTGTTKEIVSFTFNGKDYTFSGETKSYTLDLPDTHGATITVSADGSYAIDATNADGLSLGDSIPGSLTFTARETTYEANGSVAGSVTDTAKLSFTVVGVNDSPVIVAGATDAQGLVKEASEGPLADPLEGALLVDKGTIAFSDVDLKDTHTTQTTANGANYLGAFALDAVNESTQTVGWTFPLDDKAIDFLSEGEELTQTYNVVVADNHGSQVTQTVTVKIVGTNDGPDACDDTYGAVSATATNAAFTTVLGNDKDVDAKDVLSVSAIEGASLGQNGSATVTLASGGKVTMKADGTFSYDASGLTTKLYDGQHATETFHYTVSDGHGGFDTATVSFGVDGTGQAPVVVIPEKPEKPVANNFPLWPQDISHFTLYFEPNLGGDSKPNLGGDSKPKKAGDGLFNAGDGLYTVKIDVPPSIPFPKDMDTTIDAILGYLRSTNPDPYKYIDASTKLLGVAIKGGQTPETYYAFSNNTNGIASDPVPTPDGKLVLNNDVDLAFSLPGGWILV